MNSNSLSKNLSPEELEFQKATLEAHQAEFLHWYRSSMTQEFLLFLQKEEQSALEKSRNALCATPPDSEKAVKMAVRSKTINEILSYVRARTE